MKKNNKIIWLTGQPGSGKTTLANSLRDTIFKKLPNVDLMIIDGDDLRNITINKDYSRKGRERNIRTAQNIAQFIFNKNYITIVSLVAPYRSLREDFKSRVPVLEVYLHTSQIRGREEFFAEDYNPPTDNFLSIDTGKNSIKDCTNKILSEIEL